MAITRAPRGNPIAAAIPGVIFGLEDADGAAAADSAGAFGSLRGGTGYLAGATALAAAQAACRDAWFAADRAFLSRSNGIPDSLDSCRS